MLIDFYKFLATVDIMSYEIELIRKEELRVSEWSGGTTTQLAIYPKDAIYSERNFRWRLSSAKVEVVESTFTHLPDIDRIIMIIDGELNLEHEGHHKCTLKPFDQDSFSGNWTTDSFGKVTDFNLMMDENCKGELEAVHLDKGQSTEISFCSNKGYPESALALYSVHGEINVKIDVDETLSLFQGDFILISSNDDFEDEKLEIYNMNNSRADLIKANIYYR